MRVRPFTRLPHRAALCALPLLALAAPVRAHDRVSSLAEWGDFGEAAACVQAVGAAAAQCGEAVVAARRACLDAQLEGATCDAQAVGAAVGAAQAEVRSAIEAGCAEQHFAALGVHDADDLEHGALHACGDFEEGALAPAYAPVADGDAVRAAPRPVRRCVRAASAAAVKLSTHAMHAWRRAFDVIARRALTADQKDALVARAAQRIGRARAMVERMLGAGCARATFDVLYPQGAASFLADAALAGGCFAEGAYGQGAVTCAHAAAAPAVQAACTGGFAGSYPCWNVDLAAYLPLSAIGGGQGNDVWGWTDAQTGREYALMGRTSGTAFVDVTTPSQPVYLGNLPTHSVNSTWRGIKVYRDHAFVVSEASGHGLQVFDLTQLRSVPSPPRTFTESAYYGGFSNSHTLALNEESGFAYAAGTNTCAGGLHIVDVRNPLAPAFAGCVSSDGYTHETQCVTYRGPDVTYAGREICFSSNTDTLTIIDVTNKAAPVQLSRTGYANRGYTHQGWLTPDHRYFLMNDELDEQNFGFNTRTIVWSVGNLDAPAVVGSYYGPTAATDHNLYIRDTYAFESNYRAGLRILDLTGVSSAALTEVAYFDVVPSSDATGYAGTWTNYPFFASGTVLVSGIESGLFILRPQLPPAEPTPTATTTGTPTATPTPTDTRTPSATPTITPIPVIILDPIAAPIVVGGSLSLTGSGFTAGSVVMLFVATSSGAQGFGPFTPSSWSPTALTVAVPASIPLGAGFASVVVVNTDQGYAQSNAQSQLLYGAAAWNIPSIYALDDVAVHPVDSAIPLAYVETVIVAGETLAITGEGFNAPLVNLFTAGGNRGPLTPLPGGSATAIQVAVPDDVPTGPGSVQVVNSPYTGNVLSNAVAVVIGATVSIAQVSQAGGTITVDGTGFSTATVINFFNRQGDGVVNLGGFDGQGQPRIALTVVSPTQFTFGVPPAAVSGAAYVQALNPPFIPFTSSGADPDGAFALVVP